MATNGSVTAKRCRSWEPRYARMTMADAWAMFFLESDAAFALQAVALLVHEVGGSKQNAKYSFPDAGHWTATVLGGNNRPPSCSAGNFGKVPLRLFVVLPR